MKFLVLALLTQIVTSAPLISQILGPGGIAEVDLSYWSVISPSSDTTKININKGYRNYVGPQYAPASVYGGYDAPADGSSPRQFGHQKLFNLGFQGGRPVQGFPQVFPQSRDNQLRGSHA